MTKSTLLFSTVATISMIASTASAREEISFEQVLAAPANVELNYAFARQRMDAGDLVSAAATLERLLFIEPNWDEARLLYAGVLYQLGDFSAAKRELKLLEGRSLNAEDQQRLESYADVINSASKKTSLKARVSAGLGYDENAVFLITEDVGGTGTKVDQFSFVGRGSVNLERSISDATNRKFFAKGDIYTKQFADDNIDGEEIDGYILTSAKAGIRESRSRFGYQVNLAARNVNVQGSEYLTEVGVETAINRKLNGRSVVSATISYHDQQFSQVFGSGDASELRTGDRIDGSIFGKYAFSARLRGDGRIEYRVKSAEDNNFDYTFWGLQAGLDYFYPDSSYVRGHVVYRDYDYDGGFGSTTLQREDEYTYGRISYGFPLGNLAPKGSPGENLPLTFEASANYTSRTSNIDTFDFDGYGLEARLIWDFSK